MLTAGGGDPVRSVALSACGRWLAAVRADAADARGRGDAVEVWDRPAAAVTATLRHRAGVWGMVADAPPGGLAVFGPDGLTCYELPDRRPRRLAVTVVGAVAARGRLVGLVRHTGAAELVCWDAGGDWPRPVWSVRERGPIGRLTADPSGEWVGVVVQGRVVVRASTDGLVIRTRQGPPGGTLLSLLDDRRAVFAVDSGLVATDLTAGRVVASLRLGGTRLNVVGVSPDGRWVAVCGRPGLTVYVADALTVRQTYTFPAAGNPTCVAFAPDGLTAACGTSKGEVVVWDVD